MKIIKKFVLCLMLLLICLMTLKSDAATEKLYVEGRKITYDDGSDVLINTQFVTKDTEFRAVWVSPLTGDITGYTTETQYKKQIIEVLEAMEAYNFNVMLFHVRIMNDALYESKYNAWSTYYNENPNWDALPWIIDECHKRGIEFHAWMNPYRVTTNVAKSLTDIAKESPTSNAAHNPDNLLKGTKSVILDPGSSQVRNFLVSTCMELVENYEVDAIHFDDYFYCAGIDDSKTYQNNNDTGLSIDNWRREQINIFIKDLSKNLKSYNAKNNRCVQLGISPTGVYRNGNGNVTYDGTTPISNGSATGGYAHYGSPLYADTIKWIENEWIDYILPQTYHAITNPSAPYCDLVGWWDKMGKYSNVNFYASIGLYMNGDSGNSSWSTNEHELYQQALFVNTMENIKGVSIYNCLSMKGGASSGSTMYQMRNVWNREIILPEVRTSQKLSVGKVNNFSIVKNSKGNLLSFDKLDDAKFYVIYRSTSPLTYQANEVLDVIGGIETNGIINYEDKVDNTRTYYYGIKAQSYSLSLGEGVSKSTEDISNGNELDLGQLQNFNITENLLPNEKVTVFWDELLYSFGDKVKFEISYAFDDDIANIEDSQKYTNYYYQKSKNNFDIIIPENASKIKVIVKAYNDLGYSISTIEKEITKSLAKINNFGYLGTSYDGCDLVFVWNALNNQEVKYAIQYSLDNYTWNTLTDNILSSGNTNIRVSAVPKKGTYYYRVNAYLDGKNSYSDMIQIYTKGYLGEYKQFKINDNIVEEEIPELILKEDESVKISWETHTSDTIYTIMVSSDLKNWTTLKVYSPSSTISKSGSIYNANLVISYSYNSIYFKVTGNENGLMSDSEIFKIYCVKDYVFYDEVVSYLNSERNTFIETQDLFR